MMLNRFKCETITALNGQSGLQQLTRNPDVNLLIVDMNMPHMSGREFIRRVKQLGTFENVPIITISSDGMAYDAQAAITFAQGNL